MNLAFSFLDNIKSVAWKDNRWEKITSNVLECVIRPVQNKEGIEIFGAWLANQMFVHCKHARPQVIREIVIRLSSASAPSVVSSSFGHSKTSTNTAMANLCVFILENICRDCRLGVMEVSTDVNELFIYLTEFAPPIASRLITVLSPFFKLAEGMADRCSIAIRKASFSKERSSRQAAVSAILALLRSHLKSTGASSSSSSASTHSQPEALSRYQEALRFQHQLKQQVGTGVSVEEIMVLLRRFLQHQSSVRSLLYKDIHEISADYPAFRPIAMRLLRGHFLGLMATDSEAQPNGVTRQSESRELKPDFLAFLDENNRPQENFKDLVTTLLSLVLLEVPEEERGFDLFSQSGGGSQVTQNMSFTQKDLSMLSKEGPWCCETLWQFSKTIALLELDQFASSSPQSNVDFLNLEVLFSAYYTAMVVVTIVPQSLLETATDAARKHLLLALIKKCKVCLNVANKYVKSQKSKKEKEKKSKVSSSSRDGANDSSREMNDQTIDRTSATSGVHDTEIACGYQLLTELRFISKILNRISLLSVGDEEDDLCDGFISGILLERAVVCLEKIISHYHLSDLTDGALDPSRVEFKKAVHSIVKSLFPSLTRVLMLLRQNVLAADDERKSYPLIFLSLPVLNAASTTQLVIRAMLGCLKVVTASHHPHDAPESFIVNVSDMIDDRYANSDANDEGVSSRTYTAAGEDLGQRDIKECVVVIQDLLNNNIDLMLHLQGQGGEESADAAVLVVLIGELFGCFTFLTQRFADKSALGICDPRPAIADRIVNE